MKQRTIARRVSVDGVGLHTGAYVHLTFHPAPVDHGCKFQRTDLEGEPVFSADVNRVISTDRSTTIKVGDASVMTVEHVLSALHGLCIDNILIELSGPEVPILDGSAADFVEALRSAEIVEQDAEREYFIVDEPIAFQDPETGSELIALPHDGFEVVAMIDFDSPILGQQFATLKNLDDYAEQIAPCRTFVFLHELEMLFEHDLIRGGDLNNAIVIADRPVAQYQLDALAQRMDRPTVEVTEQGILNTIDLKFQNEPARHKLLDILGDTYLLGRPIKGKIVATKPGHRVNVEFTLLLRAKLMEQRKLRNKPKYDPNKEPVIDTVTIEKWMPHRFPMLLVDKVIELTDTMIVGVKNVTFNEHFFQGHFPNNPVMPGVLQIEAMAQTGGLLVLSKVDDPGNYDCYFLKIDSCKFKAKVVPGDTLILKLELVGPIRRGITQMIGTAYVGNKIVSEAELTAQVVKRS